MNHLFRHILTWLSFRIYTVCVRNSWASVRFMLGAAMIFIAAPEQWALAEKVGNVTLYRNIYFIAAVGSVISGLYYLVIGSDPQERTAQELKVRYVVEVITSVAWLWVFSIDVQAHAFGALTSDEAVWIHHIGVNITVAVGLTLAAFNELGAKNRAELYEEITISLASVEEHLYG